MFFIAGLNPKITVLDKKPVMCPVCGLAQAYYKRADLYLNLFFIPILRIRKGEPFIMCERCERQMHEMGDDYEAWLKAQNRKCSYCGSAMHQDFIYCPFCGRRN